MDLSGDEGDNGSNGNPSSQEVEHEKAPSERIGFSCQMDSTKAILSTITGIHNGKKDHHVIVRVFDGSITFLTHDKGQNMQGQATILRDSFSFYEQYSGDKRSRESEPEKDAVEFKINLHTVIQCLSIFGAANAKSTSLRMDYNDWTNEFRLILQHGKGALTECSVQTLIDDIQLPNYFLAFGESETIGEIIVLSESLRDAFSEIYSMYVSSTQLYFVSM